MKAELRLPYDPRIVSLFAPEDREVSRAAFDVRQEGAELVFLMEAQDAASMRVVFNNITKILTVWEQSAEL